MGKAPSTGTMPPEVLNYAFVTTAYLVAAGVFLYLFARMRRIYFLHWTMAWCVLVMRALTRILIERQLAAPDTVTNVFPIGTVWLESFGEAFMLAAVVLTIAGGYSFMGRALSWRFLSTAIAAGAVLCLSFPIIATRLIEDAHEQLVASSMIESMIVAAVCAWGAIRFGMEWNRRQMTALLIIAIMFGLLAIYKGAFPFVHFNQQVPPGLTGLKALGNLFELATAIIATALMIVVSLEQVRAELKESEHRFRQFFESASDPIFLVDPETGEIADANPRSAAMLGYTRDEFITMKVQDLGAPEGGTSPAGLLSKIRPNLSGRETVFTHYRHREGRLIPVSVTRSLIEIGDRQMLLVDSRDISDLRQQERALASRISQLQAVQRVSQVLARTLKTEDIPTQLYENLRHLFTLDYFSVDLINERAGRLENLVTMQMVSGVISRVPNKSVGGGLPDREIRRMLDEKQARIISRNIDGGAKTEDYPECLASLVVVPLIAGDETVGVLSAGTLQPDGFHGSHLDLLQHVTSIAGIALQNARLYEFQQNQVKRQQFLAELGPGLITNLDAFDAVGLVASRLQTFLELSDVEVWLASEDLSIGALYRAYPSGRPASITTGKSKATPTAIDIISACFSSGLAVVENDCRNSRLIPEAWAKERNLKSCMAAPIMIGEKAIGILRLDDSRRYGRFRSDDSEFVKLVAQITATVLQAARLFQQVKASEQRFSQVVEASSIGIVILKEHLIEFANAAFLEMLDLTDIPVHSLSVFELFPSEYEKQWRRAIEEAEAGGNNRLEGWMQRPDGNRIWSEVFISEIKYGGVKAIQLLVEDVTRKRAETAQRQSDLRVRSVGTLTAGIAQDFQQLFSAILGHIAYLKMEGVDGDRAERSLLSIEAALMRALEFTRQLMTFAETSEGGIETIDLNDLIIQAARLHEGIVPERPRMKFDLAPNLPRVRGNIEQLRQAFLNLLLAVSDRAGEGNTVLVQSMLENLDGEKAALSADMEPGQYITVLISERRGVIDAATAEALLSATATSMGRGSLGMSVLLSTVRSHQGTIEVRKGGTATTIALMLPVDSGIPSTPGARLLSGTTQVRVEEF